MTRETHGGDIYRAAEELGVDVAGIVDFSASINPLGVPEGVRTAVMEHLSAVAGYPDPDARKLRRRIAGREGVEPESIVCGNGSTELIHLVVRALRPRRVLVPAPTFGEYERACAMLGAERVVHYRLEREDGFRIDPERFISAMAGCDMAFLCNPNNPTGGLVGLDGMLEIAQGARGAGCTLVVDEAFIDFCAHASVVREAERNPRLIVLRSFTKFYALSGLRIGYMVLSRNHLERVREAKEPWTVNIPAQAAAFAALDDRAYEEETLRVISEEKARLEEGFDRLGIARFPSAANYYLLSFRKARHVHDCLRRGGILTRDCSSFIGLDETFLRVAVKSGADNLRLLEEVARCMG
jgi:threonine-phosphate decarboxylase